MATLRKPLEGTWNILRFNWHFYAAAAGSIGLILLLDWYFERPFGWYPRLVALAGGWVAVVSLLVSAYVYDLSGLYHLQWLPALPRQQATVVNIHAGFDEVSALLRQHLNPAELRVFDFYDPARHTEPAIRRARRAYPAFAGTQAVQTQHLPLPTHHADLVVLLLAAHEIRQEAERVAFFQEVRRVLHPAGQVVVVEHLRDPANLLAYTVGAFHFYSRRSWQRVFLAAGLRPVREQKLTPFVSAFTLQSDGDAA